MDVWALYQRWVVVDQLAHRPDPATAAMTLCGQEYSSTDTVSRKPPRKVRPCDGCAAAVRVARQAADVLRRIAQPAEPATAPEPEPAPAVTADGKDALRAALRTERQQRHKRQAAESTDRQSRQGTHGSSIHTVPGGLPTLGRGHH